MVGVLGRSAGGRQEFWERNMGTVDSICSGVMWGEGDI